MKILVLSDLHLEQSKSNTFPERDECRDSDYDVVVLAGDIARGAAGIEWAANSFRGKEIVYVAGVTEFLGATLEPTLEHLRDVACKLQVHFLERDVIEIDGIRFLGATLWSDYAMPDEHNRVRSTSESLKCINDFDAISTERPLGKYLPTDESRQRKFLPQDARDIHIETMNWLQEELAKGDPARTVVVTHHDPHLYTVMSGDAQDLTPGAFITDLTHLIGRSFLWVHGYRHQGTDYRVGDTQVLANPRGYEGPNGFAENEIFAGGMIVEFIAASQMTKPDDRARALQSAGYLMRELLMDDDLYVQIKEALRLTLQYYPTPLQLEAMISEVDQLTRDGPGTHWLAPNIRHQSI